MTQGLVLAGSIWEYSFVNDDEVGGAVPSGTVVYSNVRLRLENSRNSLDLAIQGFETSKFFSAVVQPQAGMRLVERKHFLQITSPPNSNHYLKMFRIVNIQESNFHPSDPRRYIILNLERVENTRSNSHQ
jgi:hypothetical protein